MRPFDVPKVVYLLSDGRTHDFPKDAEMADLMRRQIPNVHIWAYGTGEYVAMSELLNITRVTHFHVNVTFQLEDYALVRSWSLLLRTTWSAEFTAFTRAKPQDLWNAGGL